LTREEGDWVLSNAKKRGGEGGSKGKGSTLQTQQRKGSGKGRKEERRRFCPSPETRALGGKKRKNGGRDLFKEKELQ